MTWKEAARLSSVAFTELSLQAVYAFRQGNVPPPGPPGALVANARRRVLQSKAILSLVLGLLAFGAALLLQRSRLAPPSVFSVLIPPAVFQAGVVTGLLSLDVAFLWWTGLQVLPTFLSSGILPVLEPLPVDNRTLGRTAALLYLRLFDLPVLTVLVATPLFVGLALGPLAGLAILPGVVAAVTFALALSLFTGRFFVRRVQGSRGGGGWTVVRWGYLVLWLVPAFTMFAFVTAAPAFFRLLGNLAQSGPSVAENLLLAAFPYPLAVWPAYAGSGPTGLGLGPAGWTVLIGASLGYLALAAWTFLWLMGSVRRIGLVPPTVALPGPTARFELRPQRTSRAVLTKDLRISSRTPGYAFLILLPILDALAIGVWTYVSAPPASTTFALGLAAVTTAALLATFFGPAFFAIEVVAYSYGRTLPLSDRPIVLGKVALVALMYLVASALVLGLTLLRVFEPVVFVAFVLAELPAVVGASLLELGVLFRRARKRGLPIPNLYAGAWYGILVSLPGLFVAALPLVAFRVASHESTNLGLGVMAGVAVVELAVCAPFALGRGGS